MRILIVGAGMYVTGRDETGPGVILSSLGETSREIPISEVVVCARHAENRSVVAEATRRINRVLGSHLQVSYRAVTGNPAETVQDLWKEGPFDGAVVCVPDHLHFPYLEALLEQKAHCLSVKPLTPTLAEAKILVEIQEKNNVYGAVEFHKRLDETNRYLKRALFEGEIGSILYFNVQYSQKIEIPAQIFRKWAAHTNIFQYLGVHYVDLIYYFTGFVPVKAMAVGDFGVLRKMGIETPDAVHAVILWQDPSGKENGFSSHFSTNWVDPSRTSAMSDQRIWVVGTEGRLECDQKNRGLEQVSNESGIRAVNPYFAEYLPDSYGRTAFSGYGYKSINRFIRDVANLMDGKIVPEQLEGHRPSFREALVSTAVIDAVNRSLNNNFQWRDVDVLF